MKIIPAIDLYQGKCVRLYQGRFDQVTVYSEHPAEIAQQWETAGAEIIHLVDLEGACSGHSENLAQIKKIAQQVKVPLQLGGGIRSFDQINGLIDLGVSRLVIGTLALEQPELIKQWAAQLPTHIVVGIDASQGMVAVRGWKEVSQLLATDLASQYNDSQIAGIIYTDIARDGTLEGPNIQELSQICHCSAKPVIASGGIACLEDLQLLDQSISSERLWGVIAGKALYTGHLDLKEAIAAFTE